jgi:hypothetical protein
VPALAVADQRVDRAGAFGARAEQVAQPRGRLLVRQRDVGAGTTGAREAGERGREIAGCRFDRGVIERDRRLPAERGMDARRQRMQDRIAEHGVTLAGNGCAGHGGGSL